MGGTVTLIVVALLVIFAIIVVLRTVRIVPQQTAQIVERLGSYSRTLDDGMHFLVPFVDKVRANIDLREQVVSFPPQPVITSDNLVVNIDTVIYYSVIDAKSAVYEIANFIQGIEQLTVTTLRNVIGSLDLEQALTSRDQINGQLRGVLDEATGNWGIRVNRVELKAIDPPHSVQETMEKQMRAERDRRAAILTAEGFKQSAILTAEGEKQSQILRAEGSAQARILEAQGQARAIQQVKPEPHDKVDTWPHLMLMEFVALLAMTAFLVVLSVILQAPLLEPANFNSTPNPSKAPWYFLGLQELLSYFDPQIAGVTVPTIIGLVGFMMIPYVDRNPSTKPSDRKFAIMLYTFFLAGSATLTILGVLFRGEGFNFAYPWEAGVYFDDLKDWVHFEGGH